MAFNNGKASWLKEALGPLPYSKDLKKALEIREGDNFFEIYRETKSNRDETDATHETVSEYSRQRHSFPTTIRLYPIGAETDAEKQWMSRVVAYLQAFIHPVRIETETLKALTGPKLKLFTRSDGLLHGSNVLQALERSSESSVDILHVGCSFKSLAGDAFGGHSKNILVVEVCGLSLALTAKTVLSQWGKMKPCRYFKCAMNPGSPSGPFCLCVVCLRKLSTAAPRFDVNGRYEALCQVYQDIGATTEMTWIAERLATMGVFSYDGAGTIPSDLNVSVSDLYLRSTQPSSTIFG